MTKKIFDKIFKQRNKQKMWDILRNKPPSMEELVDTILNGNEEEAEEAFRKIIQAKVQEELNKKELNK